MPIHSEKNLYPGINAHISSILQNEPGGWETFHTDYLTLLRLAIDVELPPGYFARSERSLQIGAFDAGDNTEEHTRIKPDITIFRNPRSGSATGVAVPEAYAPIMTLPISETLEEEDELSGVVIYQAGEGGVLGRPITRIEVLSPANKPGRSNYGQYTVKRLGALKSGMRLVEIDYLHQTPPIIWVLPDYSNEEPGAYPYSIIVSDPRPTFEKGTTAIYAFDVDDPIPVIHVPLAGADKVKIDFGAVYNQLYESSRFFHQVVDYEQDPPAFDRYSEADRERIQKLLADIRHQQASGSEE